MSRYQLRGSPISKIFQILAACSCCSSIFLLRFDNITPTSAFQPKMHSKSVKGNVSLLKPFNLPEKFSSPQLLMSSVSKHHYLLHIHIFNYTTSSLKNIMHMYITDPVFFFITQIPQGPNVLRTINQTMTLTTQSLPPRQT